MNPFSNTYFESLLLGESLTMKNELNYELQLLDRELNRLDKRNKKLRNLCLTWLILLLGLSAMNGF
jgi:hypothetical protein